MRKCESEVRGKGSAMPIAEDKLLMKKKKKPMGWSHYTRLHREGLTSSESDPFPQLPPVTAAAAAGAYHQLHTVAAAAVKHGSSTAMQLPQVGLETLPVSYSLVVSGKDEGHDPAGKKRAAVVDELKRLYAWADDGLIQDVLTSVGGDKKMAIEWLDSMAASLPAEDFYEENLTSTAAASEKEAEMRASILDRISSVSISSLNEAVLATEGAESYVLEEREEMNNDGAKLAGSLTEVPVETEWQEDDPYLAFRKDALRAARAGHRHARGAVHAFNMGDHSRARVLSAKAQEERICAQALNAKAASEILRVKNSNRDIWNLDLHGLHASEAVDALQDRLLEIELAKHSLLSSARLEKVEENYVPLINSPQNESRETELENINLKQHAPKRLATKFSANKELTVITGSGTHSQGGAMLPSAIKDYLYTNQYFFYEPRSGIITVKPKKQFQD
ncbi:hypothetical protein O6H91_19G035600 [Diphasiastrum complanatum]|uniref:Uncharacterized protein n=2 Tax=Diphasiastrum complanatum TaxID=34168 RepID=A0ACC2AU04_DIPCM|nr:hypothetical protein O6H91_19G035600 [Diphasiastrum complanatum]